MTDSPIVFLDSGIGGLPYLEWVSGSVPGVPLYYVADTRHFPYGELPAAGVRKAVVETADMIFRTFNPRLLVIACNTASVAALDAVREIATCPVVGTVPAVKPAAAAGNGEPIGVLATEGTVNSPYLDDLISAFAPDHTVRRQAAGDIVRYVEERWLTEGNKGALPVIRPALEKLKSSGVGSVVIGCTHFLHVMPAIAEVMGPDVALVDSRDGVGRRIIHLLDGEAAGTESDANGRFYITSSGESDSRYREFASGYGLEWCGTPA